MKECSICGYVKNGRSVLVKSGCFVKHQNNLNWLDMLALCAGVVFTRKITEEIRWDKQSKVFVCKSCSAKHKMSRLMSYLVGNFMKFLVALLLMSLFAPLAIILVVTLMDAYDTIPANWLWGISGVSALLLPFTFYTWRKSMRWGFNKGKWSELVHEKADRFELI